ncbi:hypothetical protein E6R60_26790 [Streptomyces sp. A0642]|uniref:hypothetical protein n=1 Tax=Streptomyces sp. A0642 TaxID=2563100 RepID=UPI0010A20796|nr:hypothetical protein [Streptomyces sp. A0642]THA72538.1 hypothetical protein E6R60_26790 [Streptomyces sp. A0642]
MPQANLHAVRDNLALKKSQEARLVTFLALDDILGRNRPRWQWTHPQLAEQLDTDPVYVRLLQSYLEYRRTRKTSSVRGIRLHEYGAQIYDVKSGMPLDLVAFADVRNLSNAAKHAALLREAADRTILADPDVAAEAEAAIARACMTSSWEALSQIYFDQRAARTQRRNKGIAA